MTLAERKAELRRVVRAARNAAPAEDRAVWSAMIAERVCAHPWFLEAESIHLYHAFGSEADTGAIANEAWRRGKVVVMMIALPDSSHEHVTISPDTSYRRTSLGILEPIDGAPYDAARCDLVLVPALAVDTACRRLGYGRGYYDRFLSGVPAPRLGLAFELQVVEHLPVEPHDLPLDAVATEHRLILPPS